VAKVIDDARHASAWGVSFTDPSIDVDRLRAFKQRVVDKLTGGVGQVARMRKVNFLQGRATLEGPRALTVAGADRTQLRFEHAILATGSQPTACSSRSAGVPTRRFRDSRRPG
jgi:dihydrolipoamide dehydrogenase